MNKILRNLKEKQLYSILVYLTKEELEWHNYPRTIDEWDGYNKNFKGRGKFAYPSFCGKTYNGFKSFKNRLSKNKFEKIKKNFENQKGFSSNKTIEKHISFLDLSTRKRRERVNDLKKQIKKMNGIGNGLFYTNHLVVDKYGKSNGKLDHLSDEEKEIINIGKRHSWLDFYFLSKKHKNVLYNATISTSYSILMEDLDAIDHSKEKIENQNEKEKAQYFLKNIDMENYYKENIEKEKFINKNQYLGYVNKDYKYAYGIGLNIVIADKKYLTIEDIEKFIQDFWDNDEIEINPEYIYKCGGIETFEVSGLKNMKDSDFKNYNSKIVGELPENFIDEAKKTYIEYNGLRKRSLDLDKKISILEEERGILRTHLIHNLKSKILKILENSNIEKNKLYNFYKIFDKKRMSTYRILDEKYNDVLERLNKNGLNLYPKEMKEWEKYSNNVKLLKEELLTNDFKDGFFSTIVLSYYLSNLIFDKYDKDLFKEVFLSLKDKIYSEQFKEEHKIEKEILDEIKNFDFTLDIEKLKKEKLEINKKINDMI